MAGQLDPSRISIERGSGLPLADQVYTAIERWIAAGALDENSRLPTTRELASAVTVDDVRGPAADALADIFGLRFEELPGHDPGLWAQPLHAQLAAR